jgi:MoaA/NifB/PqqE/SkfB family radical SAM enzyme
MLDKNLKILNELIKNNSFERLSGWQTNFTVQKGNYKELVDYVKWQLTHDQLSTIFFNCIAQWGHLTDNSFDRLNINQEDKLLLKEILSDNIFNNKKVMLGNLHSFR